MTDRIRIGVDTGGTFTDFVIYRKGQLTILKIPSTPDNPSEAILKGIHTLGAEKILLSVIHGTTVATNALLEQKGGRTALITTKGFEDILFIGRQIRHHLYSLDGEDRPEILPRHHAFGVEERTTAQGKVIGKIDITALENLISKLKSKRFDAVAVSLINSYANPFNERIIKKVLRKNKISHTISSDILPEYREYERTAITAVNAYLLPVISRYLENLENRLGDNELRIMQSNEGVISPASAREQPIRTSLSGPSGGVVAANHLGRQAGIRNMITFDMGGTSSDVSLIDGEIRRTNEGRIGHFPIRFPIIDIHSVGAGGGSIAFLDKGGSLRVGPKSAGAVPGPACYGQGDLPTVTDANLVLGRLASLFFLGGDMPLYPERSRRAVRTLAVQIGKSLEATASGIIHIANANMEKAIRVISIERGYDPRDFSLISFGGAGGMHAAEIADHLRLKRIIIPKNAGVLSAQGFLLADSIKDYSASLLECEKDISDIELEELFDGMAAQSMVDMRGEGFQDRNIRIFRSLDLRYSGQSYEITIPFAARTSWIKAFHRTHKKLYSYSHDDREIEIVNLRVKAVGTTRKIPLKRYELGGRSPAHALLGRQKMYYGDMFHEGGIYDRSSLRAGNRIKGPALITDYESTTFCPPGYHITVDDFLSLAMTQVKS